MKILFYGIWEGKFAEGTEFIRKPFKKNDLLQKIREVLDKD